MSKFPERKEKEKEMEKRIRVLFHGFCFLNIRLIQKGHYPEKENSENRKRKRGREGKQKQEGRKKCSPHK